MKRYPWNNEKIRELFLNAHTYVELSTSAKKLYDEYLEKKEIDSLISFDTFFAALWRRARDNNFVRDYHQKEKTKQPSVSLKPNERELIEHLIASKVLFDGRREFLVRALKDIRAIGSEIGYRGLAEKFDELVWSKERSQFVKEALRYKHDPARIKETLSVIPEKLIDAKIRELRGGGNNAGVYGEVFSEAGQGRLVVSEEILANAKVILSKATLKDPYVIKTENGKFSISVINSPLVGAEYSQVLEENIIRNGLELAETKKDDVVVFSGGLMFIDAKKSEGLLTTHRARSSGMTLNLKILDPRYRKDAALIRKNKPADDVVCETTREKFLNLASGWRKTVVNKNGNPVYNGKIFVTLGRTEEEIIEAAAHAEINYILAVRRERIKDERRGVEAELRYEYKQESRNQKKIDKLQAEVEWLLIKEKRTISSNVSTEDRKRFFDIVRAWVIKTLENTIPNAKVITQGTAFLSVGGKLIEVHQDREQGPTTVMLDEFMKKNAGRRALDTTLPDIVLLINSYSVNYRWAVAERNVNNVPASTHVFQLPVALNKRFLLDQLRDVIRKGSPLERLMRHEQFEPGIFRLEYLNGLWSPEMISIPVLLRKPLQGLTAKQIKEESEYVYLFVTSDQHIGHPWKSYYYDKKTGIFYGHDEAVMQILRREYLDQGKLIPIHAYIDLGDQDQGHHFETQAELHERTKDVRMIMREFKILENAIKNSDGVEAAEKLREMQRQIIDQILIRGIHWPQYQMREYKRRVLEPNADMFASIVKRSQKAGVKAFGVEEYLSGNPDMRSIAILTILGGNHFRNTVEGELNEGSFYAENIIDLLAADKSIGLSREELERIVRAPLHGSTSYGQGILKTGTNGYEWAISLRHEPARKSGANGDPLREAVKNAQERGDFTGIFAGKKVIHLSGDIHRFGSVFTSDAVVLSVAAGTGGDPYGERGFSPNNIGNFVVGIPARGPEYGPIRIIVFNHDFVRKYFEKSWDVDWNRIFKDPL